MAERDGGAPGKLTAEQRRQAEEYLGEEEGGFNRDRGRLAVFLTAVAAVFLGQLVRLRLAPRPV